LCPRWDTYIADDVGDPKFIILYPKEYIHSFIHSSKFITICNCTIQYLQKEQAISCLFIHDPKKLTTNLQSHIFFIWLLCKEQVKKSVPIRPFMTDNSITFTILPFDLSYEKK
jgi:hypothetical protein